MSDKTAWSHRAIWRIATPMMISSVAAPLLGLVDTAVMGHLDTEIYLAAVAAGAAVFAILFTGLNFLRMGATGITAQAHGADEHPAVRASLGQGLILGLVIAVLMLAFREPLGTLAIRWLGPGPEVAEAALSYFHIRIWSAPAAVANFVIIGWLLGMQNARGPLAIMLVINISNIVLDLWFVLGLGMTADGVAAGTLIAEHLGLVTGLWFVRRELQPLSGRWSRANLTSLSGYRRLISVNAWLFFRTAALMFTFAFITAQGARLGDDYLAANALLMNFVFFMAYGLDGIALAAEALTGKAVGRRDDQGLAIVITRTQLWTGLFALGFCLAYLLGGKLIVNALTSLENIRELAYTFLPWQYALPFIAGWCFLYDGVYVGTTRSREMCIVMLASVLLVFLPTWYLARPLGNHSLWLALTLFMAARSVGMHVWLNSMQKHHSIIPLPHQTEH